EKKDELREALCPLRAFRGSASPGRLRADVVVGQLLRSDTMDTHVLPGARLAHRRFRAARASSAAAANSFQYGCGAARGRFFLSCTTGQPERCARRACPRDQRSFRHAAGSAPGIDGDSRATEESADEIDVAVFTFDPQQRLRIVNRAGEQLMGMTQERMVGR